MIKNNNFFFNINASILIFHDACFEFFSEFLIIYNESYS